MYMLEKKLSKMPDYVKL